MPNLWTAGHQEFRETHFYKTCREQREISVHCSRLQRDFQHEKCTDTAFGEKAWNRTAETVSLPSRWLHLWTIPDEWTSSSAFEKETSAGKSALNFFMLTICSSTFFQCAHKNRNNELTNLICLGPALGQRERFLAIAGIASILSFFCLTWRWSNPVFVIVTTRKVSLGGRSPAGGGYQTFGGWNVENSHETWEVVPPGLSGLSIFWK